MRGERHEQRALEQSLAHQAQVEVLEVAQTAVDQLRGAARGARREVSLLEKGDAVAARGGVERHARAGDPTADDDQVEGLAFECGQRVRAWDHEASGYVA